MSLRGRLALVLAGVLAGPLIAAAVVLGVLLPRAEQGVAAEQATQVAIATVNMLRQYCLSVGDAAQSVAAELAARPTRTPAEAQAAADRVVRRHPLFMVAVVDPAGQVEASAGLSQPVPPVGTGALELGRSCSTNSPPPSQASSADQSAAELVESVVVSRTSPQVQQALGGRATAWLTITDGVLQDVLDDLGSPDAELAVLTPSRPGRLLASTDAARLQPALDRIAAGQTSARTDGWTFTVIDSAPGSPYRVVAAVPHGGPQTSGLAASAVLLLSALVAAAILVTVLASRLTRPLDHLADVAARLGGGDYSARTGLSGRDEVGRLGEAFDAMASDLQATVAELRGNRDALAETFARFGEALGRTHDLGGLLETVLEAAMRGASCVVGTALLGDVGALEERANAVAEGAPPNVTAAFGALFALAGEAVSARELVMADALEGTGPALAVPLHGEGRVVGALALARAPQARAFEPAAMQAVNALAASAGTAIANVRAHDETRRLSVTDPLTGAGNFRHLSTTLARETERAQRFKRPLSVLMLDLDHFKSVNDTLGHSFGDAVLREFARRLQTCVREVDTVARYGGEEFTVILPETDAEGAARVAARIVEVVREEPFIVGRSSRRVTVSVGVASFPGHGRTGAEVMRSADAALYAAKNAGRDRWHLAEVPPAAISGPRRGRT